MQVVHHSLEALRLTGHLLLLAHKLLARARDGTTKHKVAQRTHLAKQIESRIELVIKWFSHGLSSWARLQQKNSDLELAAEIEPWLANEWLQSTSSRALSVATKDAMDMLLGVGDRDGVVFTFYAMFIGILACMYSCSFPQALC